MKAVKPSIVCAVLALFSSLGCSQQDAGSAAIRVGANALSSSDVQRVTITVSGPAIAPDITYDLLPANGRWGGIIGGIPVGTNRTFVAEAFDGSGRLIYTGTVTGVTIIKNQTVAV